MTNLHLFVAIAVDKNVGLLDQNKGWGQTKDGVRSNIPTFVTKLHLFVAIAIDKNVGMLDLTLHSCIRAFVHSCIRDPAFV